MSNDELSEFASLMVDEIISRVRIQLDAGEGLSVADQRHMLEQLITERNRLAATRLEALQAQPVGEERGVRLVQDDRYTPYKSLADCDTAAIRAVRLLEDAEDHHANCSECEGEGVPELCGNCFPFFDAARVERRLVMQSLSALTASPPVVEREQGSRQAIIRIVIDAITEAKTDGGLAVPAGKAREAKLSHLSVIPVRGHPEKHAVFDAIMGDAIAVCPDEIAAQRVFDALTKADPTPVAQGDEVRDALLSTTASLAAAISLLEKGGKAAKKAAPSDTMFDQMLVDYRAALTKARATLTKGARDAG